MKLYRKIRNELARHVLNYRGWRTDRKLILFESDDWGRLGCPPGKRTKNYCRAGWT